MFDPLNPDSSLNRGANLVAALDIWSDAQPVGRRVHAKQISSEVCRYAHFKTVNAHGMGKCSRVLSTNQQWNRVGAWFVKAGIYQINASPSEWIREEAPGRQSATEHAGAYNAWAVSRGFSGDMSARGIVHYLRAAGYRIVAKPGNRAVYALDK